MGRGEGYLTEKDEGRALAMLVVRRDMALAPQQPEAAGVLWPAVL